MTADLIAALRRVSHDFAEVEAVCAQAADLIERQDAEVERLRGLVEVGHIIVVGPILDPSGRWWSECSCDDEFYVQATGSNKPTLQQEHAALAAHVAAILDGSGT